MRTILVMCALCSVFFSIHISVVGAHEADELESHTIYMNADGFDPERLEIKQGETVIFKNIDSRIRWPASNIHPTHSVYPGSAIEKCGSSEKKDVFDSCTGLSKGEEFLFKFDKEGRWRFHDHLWPHLTGELTVVSNSDFENTAKEVRSEKRFGIFTWAALFNKLLNLPRLVLEETIWAVFRDPISLSEISILGIARDRGEIGKLVSVAGPVEVMNRLLEETDGGSTTDCHQEAHQIGRASFELLGAEVFERGDSSCHSGFYHGAMEAFLSERGTMNLAKNIKELCDTFRTQFGTFECLHGVGHGVLAYEDYSLQSALAKCKELSDSFSTRSCYGGVFMENIVTGQGLGAIPGHNTEWLSSTDMHFPCNAVGNDFDLRFECYQMQTSWMLARSDYNFSQVAMECKNAQSDMIGVCYRSLGRDAAGYSLRDPKKILELCLNVPNENGYYSSCVLGAANVIVDFWGPKLGKQAHELCLLVKNEGVREACLSDVEDRIVGLFERPQ